MDVLDWWVLAYLIVGAAVAGAAWARHSPDCGKDDSAAVLLAVAVFVVAWPLLLGAALGSLITKALQRRKLDPTP